MRLSAIIIFCVVLCGCKKETSVEGTARQTVSERAIPFATMFIEEDAGSHRNRIVTTTADADGKYKITFSAKKHGNYGLSGMAAGCDNSIQFIDLTNGKTNHIDFHLPAFGHLKIHALRKGLDTLWLGKNILSADTVFFWPIRGNLPSDFVYEVHRNSNFVSKTKTFNVPGLDTVDVELEY